MPDDGRFDHLRNQLPWLFGWRWALLTFLVGTLAIGLPALNVLAGS